MRPNCRVTDQQDSPVFSPSSTANWLRCPVYRDLNRRWDSLQVEWEPNRLIGTALTEGLNLHYRALRDGQVASSDAIFTKAKEHLEAGFVEGTRWDIPALEKLVARLLEKAIDQELTLGWTTILQVDESLGKGRPDLVGLLEDDTLAIWDTKFRMRLDPNYADRALSEWETADQLYHYAWEAEQYFGRPASQVGVHLINATPSPKSRLAGPFKIEPKNLQFWLSGARQWWRDMQDEQDGQREIVPKFSSCYTKYGRCPMHKACHDLNRDEMAMENYYQRKPPRDENLDDGGS